MGPNSYDDEDESTAIVNLADIGAGPGRAAADRHLLVRVKGAQTGQVVSISGREWRVGRNRHSDLWLNDGGISRAHARFVLDEGGRYALEDLASANGTYVNGRKVTRHLLGDGEIIQFGPAAVFRYSKTDAQEAAMLQQLYTTSVTDALTGAFNREHFDARLDTELSYARRHNADLALLLLDVDHFKQVNDTYGHPTGDVVLAELSKVVAEDMRTEDLFARYGGEEFAVLLRNTGIEAASGVAERVRQLVAHRRILHLGRTLQVTVSIGAATLSECPEPSAMELVAVADRRLYAAKRSGRNRVVASD